MLCVSQDISEFQINGGDRRPTYRDAESQFTTFIRTFQEKEHDVNSVDLPDIGELCNSLVDRPVLPPKICQKDTNVCGESSRPFVVSHPRISYALPLQERCPSLRLRAGSDCNGQNSCTAGPSGCRRPAFPLRNTSITRQPNVWGGRNDAQMPPLRTALRDHTPSRPKISPCAALRSRAQASLNNCCQSNMRQEQQVQLYAGSRLPIPNRSGPTPARLPRPRGAICSSRRHSLSQNRSRNNDELNASLPSRISSSRRQSLSRDRNSIHDEPQMDSSASVTPTQHCCQRQSISQDGNNSFNISLSPNASLPPPRCCSSRRQSASEDRNGTFDVSQLEPNASLPPRNSNSRRQSRSPDRSFSFDESQLQSNASSVPSFSIRHDTYDVSQQPPSNGGLQRNTDEPRRNMLHGTFTMTGNIHFNRDFQELSPMSYNYSRPNTSISRPNTSISRPNTSISRPNTSIMDINEYLDNHMNVDMVAPRALAVPNSPYVPIDESAESAFNIPEQWQQMLDDRSSIGSEPLSMDISPEFQRNHGGFYQADNDINVDHESQSFRINDSLPSTSRRSKTPCRSRAMSVDRNIPRCKNRCRRNTFDRKTR